MVTSVERLACTKYALHDGIVLCCRVVFIMLLETLLPPRALSLPSGVAATALSREVGGNAGNLPLLRAGQRGCFQRVLADH